MTKPKSLRERSTGFPHRPPQAGTIAPAQASLSKLSMILSSVDALMSAMSPRQMSAATASSGKAAMPAMSEVERPSAWRGLRTRTRSSRSRHSASFSGSCPVTRRTGRAREARTASQVLRMSGLPPRSAMSLFAPIRVERPAARMTAATLMPSAARRAVAASI